ncbi:serine/threonine protein kinase [Stackebrandtia endophytica]|uniref:Serine/threonine protein kinase n=1 Tax=Stackebrandtia endophytica TaxID=1496996 RepID=A0A543AWC2_9ACTN|nr:class III lanthionine synthetase LanKC [Stackebrandtia endophytica]TQL76849.1 serine/threonine protein kinase [Stackebrandtia endophytica]
MYSWETLYIYCQQGSRWFEPLTRYQPTSEHLAVFRGLAPSDWSIRRRGLWFIANPPNASMPTQGWKIHISARTADSTDILRRVAPRMIEAGVPFKFLLDPRSVALTSGKLWPRASSGKFITIYPPDDDAFAAMATELSELLADYSGPYILSDRRVADSTVVFYRYGGFTGIRRVRADGAADLMIAAPDGSLVPDLRQPYWSPPAWLSVDPFGRSVTEEEAEDDGDGTLNGRYVVTDALQFSNRGGVYRASDIHTGTEAILKEVRPNVGLGDVRYTQDYVEVLTKEHRLLSSLADSVHYVNPLSLFEEWEHTFLAEERVNGPQLSHVSIENNPVYTMEINPKAMSEYHGRMRDYFIQLAQAIADAHDRGIVLGDLSWTNVLVDETADRVTVIDLEAARDPLVDPPMRMHTKGISSPHYIRTGEAEPRDDLYSLGAMLFGSIVLANTFLGYRPDALPRFLESFRTDLGLPTELVELIRELTDDPDGVTLTAAEAKSRLTELPITDPTAWPDPIPLAQPASEVIVGDRLDAVRADAIEVRDGIARYLRGTATPERDDRLFPGDVATFETNPHHVAYGAAGVLHAMTRLPGEVPPRLPTWLLHSAITNATHPAGLYVGQAGIAWVLDELGHTEYAAALARQAAGHPNRDHSPGILRGGAGVGMACLRLWKSTGDEAHLRDAVDVGRSLADSAVIDDDGAHWMDTDPLGERHVPLGYGNGPAGVALFLLYLHLATGDTETLRLGRAALDFELAHAVRHSDSMTTFRGDLDAERSPKLRAYFDEGTAGVLTTLVRYIVVTGDPELDKWIDRLLPDVSRKYAVMPQLFHGLAGLGNALLDVAELLDRPDTLSEAWRTAEGVLLYRIDTPEGVAFPGEQSLRESADLASGASGVGLFLDRLIRLDAGERPGNPNFVLDELITEDRSA